MVTLFAALESALLVASGDPEDSRATETADAVGDWDTSIRLDDTDPECVLVHPDRPERVFCGTFEDGLQRSTDDGDEWRRIGEGTIESDSVMSLAVNPHDADEVWAGTEPSSVYRSTDGGNRWSKRDGLTSVPSSPEWSFPPRPSTHHVRWLEVDPDDPAHLYVGIEAGALVQTPDRGETWEDRIPGSRRDTHSMTTHADASGWAWTAAGDGYAETHDGGETWHHPQDGLDHRYCWSVAVDASDPGTVLLSAASGAYKAHTASRAETYVYRKREGSDAVHDESGWQRLDDRGLPTGEGVTRAVITAADEAATFYAANNRGLFRTTDAGDSWNRLAVDWPSSFESQTVRGLAVVE